MKRVLKWVAWLVVAVLVLAVGVLGFVYYAIDRRAAKVYVVTVPPLAIPTDDASIARGKYLVEKVTMCAECHGKDLGGEVMADGLVMGRLVSANLTRGKGGIGGRYSDEDFVRALLHGVNKEGRSVIFMPSADLRLTAADLGAVIAYVRSLPPVDRELPSIRLGPGARTIAFFGAFPLLPAERIDHATVTFVPPVDAANGVSQGNYLVSGCRGCHGPDLEGGGGPPPGAGNITPVGIGGWTEKDFLTAVRDHKRPNGTTIDEAMPRAFGQMSDADLHQIFEYLKTVPAKGQKTKNQSKVG